MTSRGKIMSFFGNLPKKGDEAPTANADTAINSDVSKRQTDFSIGASQTEDNSVCSTLARVDLPLHPLFLGAKIVGSTATSTQSKNKAFQRDPVDKKKHRKDAFIVGAKKCMSIVDVTNLIPVAMKAFTEKDTSESAQLQKKTTKIASVADTNNIGANFDSQPQFIDTKHSIPFLHGDKTTLHNASTCGSLVECSTPMIRKYSADLRTELQLKRKKSVSPTVLHRSLLRNPADVQDDSDMRHSTSIRENEELLLNIDMKILKPSDYHDGVIGEDVSEEDEHGNIAMEITEKRTSGRSSSYAQTKLSEAALESPSVFQPSTRRSSRQADLANLSSRNRRRLREDSSIDNEEDFIETSDTTSLTHASDDDHDKRNTNKKTKKTIKSEKNAFHPIGECASDPEHISSCLVVNLAEESDNSFPSDPGSSPDQWNKKRSNKMRKTIIGECANERNANKLEMCRGKSSKTDHRNQLISEKFKRDQRKEGTRCAAVGACSANDFKKSSKAASFFMSKDAQLQAQAQERDFDELVKKQEKERRIQQQFQQEQCDRRTENLRGKSFIDKGNGVNPFFVIQRERAAASTSSKSEVCTVDSTYCPGVAVTAESAFWDFMAQFPLEPPQVQQPLPWRKLRSFVESSSDEGVGSCIGPSMLAHAALCGRTAIDLHVGIDVEESDACNCMIVDSSTRDDCDSSNVTCSVTNCSRNNCFNGWSNTQTNCKNSRLRANKVEVDITDICIRDACLKFAQTGATLQSLLPAKCGSKVHIDLDVLNERAISALQPKRVLETVGNKQGVRILLQWLEVWAGKRRAPRKSKKDKEREKWKARKRWMDSDSDDEGVKEGLSNILIIEGESACGKTAAVHACAAQLGFTVIEMNASHLRSTAAVKKQCSEASQSHGLGISAGAFSNPVVSEIEDKNENVSNSQCSSNTRNKSKDKMGTYTTSQPSEVDTLNIPSNIRGVELNLILFDEVDILLEEDSGLYAEIKSMAKSSKCPIILTSQTHLSFLRGLPVPPCRASFTRPTEQESTAALWRVVSPALSITQNKVKVEGEKSDVISITQDDDMDVSAIGYMSNLCSFSASASAPASAFAPVSAFAPAPASAFASASTAADSINFSSIMSDNYGNRSDDHCATSRLILENLRIQSLLSRCDFRSCILSLLLSAPLAARSSNLQAISLDRVPSVSQTSEGSQWAVSGSPTGGASSLEIGHPSPLETFDLQGIILSELTKKISLCERAPSSILAERVLPLASPLLLGYKMSSLHDHNVRMIYTDDNEGHLSATSEHHPIGDTGIDYGGSKNYTYTGLIAPIVKSISPRNCLMVGGDILTVHGRYFLQKKRVRKYYGTPSCNNECMSGKATTHGEEVLYASKRSSGSPIIERGKEGDGEGILLNEEEASIEFYRKSMTVEVLVSEIPVIPSNVFIQSDTEISFIFPAVEREGVYHIVIRLIEKNDEYESGLQDSKLSGSLSSLPLPLSTPTDPALPCQCLFSRCPSVDVTVPSTSLTTSTFSATGVTDPKGLLTIRSDVCGSVDGWVLVKDRKMRDVRRFFQPLRKTTVEDKEKEIARLKNADTSFFMTNDSHLNSIGLRDIRDTIPGDTRYTTTRIFRGKNLRKKRKVLPDEDDIASFSDSDCDSDDFVERPPPSFSSSSELAKGNEKGPKDVVGGPRILSSSTMSIIDKAEKRGQGGGREVDVYTESDHDHEAVIGVHKIKRPISRMPPLVLSEKPSWSSNTRRLNRNRILDDDEDEEGEEDKLNVHEYIPIIEGSSEASQLPISLTQRSRGGTMIVSRPLETSEKELNSSTAALSGLGKALFECFTNCLYSLIAHTESTPFREPVDPNLAQDYCRIVKEPMDLSTVASSLEEGLYSLSVPGRKVADFGKASDGGGDEHVKNEQHHLNGGVVDGNEIGLVAEGDVEVVDVSAVMADINLIWSNCRLYNHPSDPIVKQADVLRQFWEQSLYNKMKDLSFQFPCHEDQQGTRTAMNTTCEEGSVLPLQGTEKTVDNTDPNITNLANLIRLPSVGGLINPLHAASLPSYLSLGDKSVRIVIKEVSYDLQLPLAQMGIENAEVSSDGPFMPSIKSADLLRMLDEIDNGRSEPSFLPSTSARRTVDECLEYTNQNASSHPQVRLHLYPSRSSVLLSRADLTGTQYSARESQSPLERNLRDLVTNNENRAPSISIEALDLDSRVNLRAVEMGCLRALDSMWELQHNFSTVDLLSAENFSLDSFYTAPCNTLLNSGIGSGPSSGKGTGPMKGSTSAAHCESNSNLSDDESVAYEVSVEGILACVRQMDMAQCLSDLQWKRMFRDLKENSTSSVSHEERSFNIMRSSYEQHIFCLASSSFALEPSKEAGEDLVVSVEGGSLPLFSKSSFSSFSGGCSRGEDFTTKSQEEDIEEENESDQDNDEEIDEEDEEEDENEAFMKECRLVELESKANSRSMSRLADTSQSLCGADKNNILKVADQKMNKESSITGHDFGWGLNSSYLRYSLRKKRLEEFVNKDLCGEGGPFDNNCSRSLCTQMALDLLPMLGSMARSESIRDARYAEMQAVLASSGDKNGSDMSGRRISTRRNSNIVRARFQHLVCATQLSEPVLQSLLVHGFIAGRGSQGDAGT